LVRIRAVFTDRNPAPTPRPENPAAIQKIIFVSKKPRLVSIEQEFAFFTPSFFIGIVRFGNVAGRSQTAPFLPKPPRRRKIELQHGGSAPVGAAGFL